MSHDCAARIPSPREVTLLRSGEFFGTTVRSSGQPGLTFSETRYIPDLHVPVHGHEPAYFCFLVAGSYWEQYGRRRVTYGPGSVVYHPANEVHHGIIGGAGGRCFHVGLGPSWMGRVASYGELPQDAVDCHAGELAWLATRLHREFVREDATAGIINEGIVLEMLGTLMRREQTGERSVPRWLRTAEDRLHDEFASPVTVEGIAKDLNVSPVRLARAFRQHFGETLGERLRRIRVNYASDRLRDAGPSLATIAHEAGFADQSHLTRVFKRMTGMTPGEYRRMRHVR